MTHLKTTYFFKKSREAAKNKTLIVVCFKEVKFLVVEMITTIQRIASGIEILKCVHSSGSEFVGGEDRHRLGFFC